MDIRSPLDRSNSDDILCQDGWAKVYLALCTVRGEAIRSCTQRRAAVRQIAYHHSKQQPLIPHN